MLKEESSFNQTAHEVYVLHHLFPVVKLSDFRVLCFYHLERRGHKGQGIPYLMGDHGYRGMVILKQAER